MKLDRFIHADWPFSATIDQAGWIRLSLGNHTWVVMDLDEESLLTAYIQLSVKNLVEQALKEKNENLIS